MRRRDVLAAGMAASAGVPARSGWTAPAPVVLELFTSQACSSCPPADALLGELAREPSVIALAWHVDYWNNLGWRDPYASRAWTDRQRQYARRLEEDVYTPALVVNGSAMVVGSDTAAVRAAIARAGGLTLPVALAREGDGLRLELPPAVAGVTAIVAVYDPEHETPIGGGENAGRRLREYRLVREVRPVRYVAGVSHLPGIEASQGAAVLLQDAAGRVVGAADTGVVAR